MRKNAVALRVRALRRISLVLARLMKTCSRSLLKASAGMTNLDVTAEGEITFQQPCAAVERLLVLQVLEHDEPCSREELEAALSNVEPLTIREALHMLDQKDILIAFTEEVYASQCLLRLDELGLIAI
jgi:hypothetical protein